MKKLISLLILISAFQFCKADVTIPGEVDREFKIINIDNFPKWQFTFKIQHYKYFQGYQPTNVENKVIVNNEVYSCSNHGDDSFITATESNGKTYTSTIKVGGKKNFASNVKGFIEVYKIVSVQNNIVELKLVETITQTNENGETKEVIKKAGKMGIDNFVMIGLIISALFSVFGLVFMFKSKEQKTIYI